jgi:hypothetical protein
MNYNLCTYIQYVYTYIYIMLTNGGGIHLVFFYVDLETKFKLFSTQIFNVKTYIEVFRLSVIEAE